MPAAAARREVNLSSVSGNAGKRRLKSIQGLVGVDDPDAVGAQQIKAPRPGLDDAPVVRAEELGEAAHFKIFDLSPRMSPTPRRQRPLLQSPPKSKVDAVSPALTLPPHLGGRLDARIDQQPVPVDLGRDPRSPSGSCARSRTLP